MSHGTTKTVSVLIALLAGGCFSSTPMESSSGVGPEGGTLRRDSVVMDIPAGAMSSPVQIEISQAFPDASPPEGTSFVTPRWAIEPTEQQFSQPAQLELAHSNTVASEFQVVRLDSEDDTSWEVIAEGACADGWCRGDIHQLGIYAAVTSGPLQAAQPDAGVPSGSTDGE
jgi:hypothetical protein